MTRPRHPTTRALVLLTVLILGLLAGAGLLIWRFPSRPVFVPIPPELVLDYSDQQFESRDNAFHLYESLETVENRLAFAWQTLAPLVPSDYEAVPPPEWTATQVAHARRWLPIYHDGFDVLRRATTRPFYVGAPGHPHRTQPHQICHRLRQVVDL